MTKGLLALLGINIILVSVFFAVRRYSFEASRSSAEEASTSSSSDAELTIQDQDIERVFRGPVVQRMTFIQALYAAAIGAELDMKYSYQNGATTILSLNGKVNDGKRWHFYLNGQLVDSTQLDNYQIHNRDLLKAVYE